MRFRILGSGSGYPELGKHHSAYYIETANQRFLFDCGEGTSQQLLRYELADNEIDAIIISHFHPDHVAGIFMVLQMFYLRKRTKKLWLFVPEKKEAFLDILNFFYSFPKRFTYEIQMEETAEVGLFFQELKSYHTSHLLTYKDFIMDEKLPNEMKSYSLLITGQNQKLFISSDILSIKEIPFAEINADIYILDGMHPNADEIIDFLKNETAKVILSHGLSPELEEKIKNREIELADETKMYCL
jgi:ribonuclease BN (tRNA processing enzyme)